MTLKAKIFLCLCALAIFDALDPSSADPTLDNGDLGIPGNVIEEYMNDWFSKELTTAKRQNMTDCMARLLCENICQRTIKGEIKDGPLISTAQMLGRTPQDSLGYLITGGDRGYEFGQQKQCHLCANKYPNCFPEHFEQIKSSSAQYERNMLKGAESTAEGDFLPFE